MSKNEIVDKIEVDLSFGKLVVEKSGNPDFPEVYIGLEDSEKNWQDLVVVGRDYSYDEKSGEIVFDDKVAVGVWSDKDSDDVTHKFFIEKYDFIDHSQGEPLGNIGSLVAGAQETIKPEQGLAENTSSRMFISER